MFRNMFFVCALVLFSVSPSQAQDCIVYGGSPPEDPLDTLAIGGCEIDMAGDLVFLSRGIEGLQIIDVSDPYNLQLRGAIDVTDDPYFTESERVAHSGDLVYYLEWYETDDLGCGTHLNIVSVADPDDPQLVSSTYFSSVHYRGIAVDAATDRLFLGGSDVGVFDISDPATPALLYSLELDVPWGMIIDFALAGDYIYFNVGHHEYWGDVGQRIVVADVSNLPTIVETYNVETWPNMSTEYFIDGSYLFVSCEGDYIEPDLLRVFSLANPGVPALVTEVALPEFHQQMYLLDGVLHLGGGGQSITAVDVHDPGDSSILGTLALPEESNCMVGGGAGCLFLAGDEYFSAYPPQCGDVTSVPSPEAGARLAVSAWPNPFNPEVNLSFSLPEAQRATVTIHDVAGRRVATLADGLLLAGTHQLTWSGVDDRGVAQSSGVYLVRVTGERHLACERLVLLK